MKRVAIELAVGKKKIVKTVSGGEVWVEDSFCRMYLFFSSEMSEGWWLRNPGSLNSRVCVTYDGPVALKYKVWY